jgi:hypothetical protein
MWGSSLETGASRAGVKHVAPIALLPRRATAWRHMGITAK